MSSKKCIYLNCNNTGAGEITLFSFPRDEARRNLWLQLAGRSSHTLNKSDCLCELHFGRQFISSNQRRKVLVGVSVPYAFDQTENDEEQQIEALDECERIDINEMFGEDDEQHEEEIDSYSSNSAIEHVEHVTVDVYSPETIVCDQPPDVVRNDIKRKISENSFQNGTSQQRKLVKIELNKSQHKNGIEATKKQYGKDEGEKKAFSASIIDHPDVSIFNIRGEEFIQMPKSVYLEEKSKLESSHLESYAQEIIKLREELKKYKNAVQMIKNQLKTLP